MSRIVALVCIGVFAAAAGTLLVTGTSDIRYSADHDRVIPVWHVWLPVLVGMALTRLVPPRLDPVDPTRGLPATAIGRQAASGVAIAVGFAAGMLLLASPGLEGWQVGLKIGLLAILPALLIGSWGRWTTPAGWWHWAGPAVAAGGWLALAWLGPFGRPFDGTAPLLAVVGGFLINSVLEESFYRVTLQTRLERVTGRWAGIAAAALLWAAWHVAIQGTGRPAVDLATVVAHQGVLGLFLGYLWSRYRNPWALLIVHGAINAPVALLVSIT